MTISCHVEANPKAEVVWIKHKRHLLKSDERIKTFKERESHYLSLKNVTKDDFGEYICEASNKIGISRASIVVVGNDYLIILPYKVMVTNYCILLGSPEAPRISFVVRSNFVRKYNVS